MPNITLPDMLTDEYLTISVNQLMPILQRLSAKNLMMWEGIYTTNIAAVMVEDEVQILTARELDERGDLLKRKRAKIYRFEAQFYPHEDVLRPSDIQNLKPFPGSGQTQFELVEEAVMKRLARMTRNYDATYEWILMNMLKGQVMNPDGTVLINFYQQFNRTKQTVDFELDNPDTNVMEKCELVAEKIEDGLAGDTMLDVEVQVSYEFWKQLVHHPKVLKAYERYQESLYLREGWHNKKFSFGPLTFERENRKFKYKGNTVRFLEQGKGIAYPTGTMDTFEGKLCPADMNQYVNTEGQRYYISTEDLPHGKGVELHMEARPVAYCKRLDALVEVSTSVS